MLTIFLYVIPAVILYLFHPQPKEGPIDPGDPLDSSITPIRLPRSNDKSTSTTDLMQFNSINPRTSFSDINNATSSCCASTPEITQTNLTDTAVNTSFGDFNLFLQWPQQLEPSVNLILLNVPPDLPFFLVFTPKKFINFNSIKNILTSRFDATVPTNPNNFTAYFPEGQISITEASLPFSSSSPSNPANLPQLDTSISIIIEQQKLILDADINNNSNFSPNSKTSSIAPDRASYQKGSNQDEVSANFFQHLDSNMSDAANNIIINNIPNETLEVLPQTVETLTQILI
jgi:hypothetical protein